MMILWKSLLGEVYVLIPFYTEGFSAMPAIRTGGPGPVATPTEMTNAHWSVVEDSGAGHNQIFEGNQDSYDGAGDRTLHQYRQQVLFQSNQSLGNSLEWSQYITNTLYDMSPNSRDSQDMANWGNSERIGMEINLGQDGSIRETVNLRGRAIMVGYSDAVRDALGSLAFIAPGVH